jgi:cytochrome c-type biogenesis protein CcmH/NrfF
MHLIVASHLLLGEVLTWAMPIAVLIAIGVYWALLLRRRSPGAGTGKVE